MRFAFAGDREIAVRVLDYLKGEGFEPLAVCVSGAGSATHDTDLLARCSGIADRFILRGSALRESFGRQILEELDLDLIVCVHFPYLLPPAVLSIPRMGVLNLHPAYLPYNRGWHTPSWALLDDTPVGATIHFMDEGLDTGDIVHQRRLVPSPADTADSLYERILDLELTVFRESWPGIGRGDFRRTPQAKGSGTAHDREALLQPEVQEIRLDEEVPAGALLKRLRALTTNRWDEAAYFETGGKRFRVRIQVLEEPCDD